MVVEWDLREEHADFMWFINHSGDFVGFKQQTLGTKPTRMVLTRWSYNNELVHKLGMFFVSLILSTKEIR